MKKERCNTKTVLIDIQYYESLNEFEYQYGDSISYKQMEQKSYIDFKEMMFENICREIKFRKYGRLGKILTIKAEMLNSEINKFRFLLENDNLEISYGWIISNVTLIKDNKLNDKNLKFKKIDSDDKENDEDGEDFYENDLETELDSIDDL